MTTINLEKTMAAWSSLTDTLFVPRNEVEYQRLVDLLDSLIDEVGEDESHPLASMMEVIGVLISDYESAQIPELIIHQQ